MSARFQLRSSLPEDPVSNKQSCTEADDDQGNYLLPIEVHLGYAYPFMMSNPKRYTRNVATYASTVIYAN